MSKSRTWTCIYNVNSWCCYSVDTHACFSQDDAPPSTHHTQALTYRQCELEYYLALEGRPGHSRRKLPVLGAKMLALRESLLLDVGAQNLGVCAFYFLYKKNDHVSVINRTDPRIPRLLASASVSLKGQNILV